MPSPRTAAALLLFLAAGPAGAWEYFEHRYLGDLACDRAGKAAGIACVVRDAPDEARRVTFGDLAAIAGDHVGDPDELLQLLADHQKVAERCGAGRCEALERTALGRILRAREFQRAGVLAWLREKRERWGAAHGEPSWDPGAGVGPCDQPVRLPVPKQLLPGEGRGRAAAPRYEQLEKPVLACRVGRGAALDAGEKRLLQERAVRSPHGKAFLAPEDGWRERAGLVDFEPLRGDCYDVGRDEEAAFARLSGFVALAAGNHAHFGSEAVARALALREEAMKGPPDLRRAARLAFAVHFATDAFASGHARTRRGRLSNAEADRQHDFDGTNGLILAVPWEGGGLVFRGYGDACLLGLHSDPTRRWALAAARAALDGAGFPLSPEVSPQNDPVPEPPDYLEVALEPGFGAGAARPSDAAISFAGRWTVQVNLRHTHSPPRLAQALVLGPGLQAIVPVAAEPIGALAWIASLPRWSGDDDAAIDEVQGRVRAARAFRRGGWSAEPLAGLAFARSGDAGRMWPAFRGEVVGRYDAYAGTSFHLSVGLTCARPCVWGLTAGLGERIR